MKKRVLFTTVDSAPYIDRWFEAMQRLYDLDIVYEHKSSDERPWTQYKSKFAATYFADLSRGELFRKVKEADACIVCGWNHRPCLETILMAAAMRKRLLLFTDNPSENQSCVGVMFKKYFLYNLVDYILCATRPTCDFIERRYGFSARGKTRFFPYAIEMKDCPPPPTPMQFAENQAITYICRKPLLGAQRLRRAG